MGEINTSAVLSAIRTEGRLIMKIFGFINDEIKELESIVKVKLPEARTTAKLDYEYGRGTAIYEMLINILYNLDTANLNAFNTYNTISRVVLRQYYEEMCRVYKHIATTRTWNMG